VSDESRQDKNNIFVGDQLEAVCKGLRRAVKFRAKLSIFFAIRLEAPVHAEYLLRVFANKEFAIQIGQSHPILGRQPVVFGKGNATTHLCQISRVKFACEQLTALVCDADIDLSGPKSNYLLTRR
jgi:hypothetical protein